MDEEPLSCWCGAPLAYLVPETTAPDAPLAASCRAHAPIAATQTLLTVEVRLGLLERRVQQLEEQHR